MNESLVQELLLEMACDMPVLRNMGILAAVPMHGGGCGNAVSRRLQGVQTRIDKTVEASVKPEHRRRWRT